MSIKIKVFLLSTLFVIGLSLLFCFAEMNNCVPDF